MMQASPVYQLLLLGQKHSDLQRVLKKRARRPLFELPLSAWLRADDRGVPHEFVRQSVRSLLDVDFDTFVATPGIGATKLRKLLELLERVLESSGGQPLGADGGPLTSIDPRAMQSEDIEAAQWESDVQAVAEAGLEDFPLGRLVASLSELPRRLWHSPLRQFTHLSHQRLHEIPYLGTRRVASILRVVTEAARLARTLNQDRQHNFGWLTRHVTDADAWIKHRLLFTERPTPEAVANGVLRPLLAQIEIDFDARSVAVACHVLSRVVAELPVELPRCEVDVSAYSKPRLHQIKELIRDALRLRWPNGEQLLQSLVDHSLRFGGPQGSVRLLVETATLFYGTRYHARQQVFASGAVLVPTVSGN